MVLISGTHGAILFNRFQINIIKFIIAVAKFVKLRKLTNFKPQYIVREESEKRGSQQGEPVAARLGHR